LLNANYSRPGIRFAPSNNVLKSSTLIKLRLTEHNKFYNFFNDCNDLFGIICIFNS